MKTHHKTKGPPGHSTGGVEKLDKCEPVGTTQRSSEIYASKNWKIEPESRDGLDVSVSASGHIVLTQKPDFGHEQQIRLHPDEARALHEMLQDAIDEADFVRHGGPSFE